MEENSQVKHFIPSILPVIGLSVASADMNYVFGYWWSMGKRLNIVFPLKFSALKDVIKGLGKQKTSKKLQETAF